jgi:hypothetical protein
MASFRQNVNGYTNAVDTSVRSDTPDASAANAATVFVDWAITGTTNNEQVLMRFDKMIGSGANQIPAGSQVHAAVLNLASTGNNAMGHGGTFHAMLQPWQATSTWNSLSGGITADDVEAVAANSASIGSAALTPIAVGGFHSFELTPDVQSWFNGTRPNYGWAILPWVNGTDGWSFGTAETGTVRNRPELRVFYTPSLVITSITHGPTSVDINFIGPAGAVCSVQRAAAVGGPYITQGPATIAPNGTGTFNDPSPLADAAFYRIRIP